MLTQSIIINDVISQAKQYEIELSEISTGWSKIKQVAHMNKMAPKELIEYAEKKKLRFWKTEPTPHNIQEIGFTDDEEQVAITFPYQ
jgi:hypothetical protein